MGDDAAGELEEGLVDVVADFPADAQAPEAVDPGVRPLDRPAVDVQAGAVCCAAAGDDRLFHSMRGTCRSRSRGRRTPAGGCAGAGPSAADVRYRVQQGHEPGDSVDGWRLPPVRVTTSGVPCASVITWCSEPHGRQAAMPRPPKTDRSYRTVPLPKMAVEALKAHLEAFPVAAGDNWLFTTPEGGPIASTPSEDASGCRPARRPESRQALGRTPCGTTTPACSSSTASP